MLLANVTVASVRRPSRSRRSSAATHTRRRPTLRASTSSNATALPRPLAAHRGVARGAAKQQPYFNLLVRCMAVRCMPSAEYVCAGEAASLNESTYHFGRDAAVHPLCLPIRRYADQVVHRMAAVAVAGTSRSRARRRAAPRRARALAQRAPPGGEAGGARVGLAPRPPLLPRRARRRRVREFGTAQAYPLVLVGLEALVHVAARRRAVALPLQRLGEDAVVSGTADPHPRPRDGAHRRRHVAAHPQLKVELLDEESGTPLLDVLADEDHPVLINRISAGKS